MASLPLAAIADAGPLIHLDELGVLAVLEGFETVLVPTIVAQEAHRHRPGWEARAPACLRIVVPDATRFAALSEEDGLDRGDAAALALWQEHRHAVLLCDDLAARRRAEAMGCEVAGTLGILLWAARTARLDLSTARRLLTTLPDCTSLHIRASLLKDVIRSFDQEP